MIKSVEGYILWWLKWATSGISLLCMGSLMAHGIMAAVDILMGNNLAGITNIFSIAFAPGFDLRSLNTGNATVNGMLGLVDAYLPFQSIANSLLYIIQIEATMLSARFSIGIYKLIPLKAT